MMDSASINSDQRRKRWQCRRRRRGLGGGGLGLLAFLLAAWGSSITWGPASGRSGPGGAAQLLVRPAYGQDFAAAGQHFASAQDAFAQGQYELAAKEFQAAYDITRDPAMLQNIGESWQRAGDGKKALAGYRAYLAAQPQAPDRAEVESRIKAIEAALAAASTPAVPPAPATGAAAPPETAAGAAKPAAPSAAAPSAPAPSAPAPSAPAPSAPAPGTDAAGGTAATEKAAAPGSAGAPAAEPGKTAPAVGTSPTKAAAGNQPLITPPEAPMSRLRTAGWVTVAVAVALATSGAIVGLGAQDRADELRRRTTILVGNQPPVYDEGQAEAYTTLKSEGTAYSQAAIALLSTAGAVAVTAGILFIGDYVRRPKAETKAKGGWALGPWLVPGSTGAGARAGAGSVAGGLVASGSF